MVLLAGLFSGEAAVVAFRQESTGFGPWDAVFIASAAVFLITLIRLIHSYAALSVIAAARQASADHPDSP